MTTQRALSLAFPPSLSQLRGAALAAAVHLLRSRL